MTLHDHWHRVDWPAVAAVLAREYPDDYAEDANAYERAFRAIAEKTPKRDDDDGMTILIERLPDSLDDDKALYWHTNGYTIVGPTDEGALRDGWSVGDCYSWALDFTPWSEWLALPVDVANERDLTSAEIVAHCLWEMTWHGYDENMRSAKLDRIGAAVGESLERYEADRKGRLN